MNQSAAGFVASGIMVLCLSSWAFADAEADYKTLFGQEEQKVAASRNTKDAADFAAKLLNSAKSVGDQKDLLVLLCEKAYDYGLKDSSGCQTAIDAMKLLAESVPDKKAQTQEKLLKAVQLHYAKSTGPERKRLGEEMVDLLVACGDDRAAAKQPGEALALYRKALGIATSTGSDRTREVMDKIKQTSSGLEAEAKLATLKDKLEADPKNTAARTNLILAYLGEFDSPAEAVKLVTSDLDERLRTYVPLSVKPVADLDEGVCLELAYWYADLAEKASPAGKGVLLGKAKACCERYLELHTAQDAGRLKGTLLLDQVAKGAEKAGPRLTKWMVIFRSKNPAIWNKKVGGKDEMAVPLSECPKEIRYLRLTRMDTREYIVIPMTWERLGNVDKKVAKEPSHLWVGDANSRYNGLHLGVAKFPPHLERGLIIILFRNDSEQFSGWGFGHVAQVDQMQGYSWNGKPIPETVFEIAVTVRELTAEERKFFRQ